jgi:hypothetical protein
MGVKVHELLASDGVSHYSWVWHCPGCDAPHQCDDRWSFNGDHERPTFGPVPPAPNCSVLVTTYHFEGEARVDDRCHSHVTDGRVTYTEAPDTTHALAGQTVEIPDWDTRHEKRPA